MRVLHVSPYVGQNPKFGGISRFVMALSAAQSDLGAEVTVASAADPAELAARNPVGSVRRVLLPTRFRRVGDWTNLRITPVLIRKLPELVKGFDVVHVHGLRTFQSAVFSILWRAGSQAMVLQPHGTASLMTGKRIQKLLFDAFLGRRLYDRATAWVALTIRERDQLREANVSSSRIQVIPNGIDTGIRSRVATKADVASWFRGLNPEVSWLIYLGRMDESKGLVALFESFRLLRAKLGGIQLLLVGPRDSSRSPGMAIARKGGGKGIYWLGNVTEDTKLQTLAAAELLVTPSFYGFPTTFVEAMLVGTPIVTCRGHGLEEEFGDIITFADSPADLAETIASLLTDSAARFRIRSLSRSIAKTTLDIRVVASQHLQLYSDIGNIS